MKATRLLYFILSSKVIVRNMSTEVMYESNHISLLLDSRMSSVLKFLLFSIYCNLKEENPITKKINSKKKKMFICENSITIVFIYRKVGSLGAVLQKISLCLSQILIISKTCFLKTWLYSKCLLKQKICMKCSNITSSIIKANCR